MTVETAVVGIRYANVYTGPNQPVRLLARNFGSGSSYLWTPGTGLSDSTIRTPMFNHNADVEYLIRITNATGCIIIDTVKVLMRISDPGQTGGIRSGIWVPKAWTPNRDGHNDKLFPLCVNIKELYYFRIFDRWGKLVFETNEMGKGWDGIFNNKPMVSDVYTWTVEATGLDGVYYKFQGNSVLLR